MRRARQENTLISYYGRLIYTFDTKYISLRIDPDRRLVPVLTVDAMGHLPGRRLYLA
jgi:hypothetical protein